MAQRLSPDYTRVLPAQVLAAITRAWRVVFNTEPKPESILVLLAQWALETGDGRAMRAFNLGNMKSRDGDGYDYCYFACWEKVNGTTKWFYPDDPTCRFRAFTTLDEGAIDYLRTLSKRFAVAWPAVLAGDPEAFARMLKAAHYFTADETAYAAGVRARMNRFRPLIPLPPPPAKVAKVDEEPIVAKDNQPVYVAPPPEPHKPKIG